MTAPPSDKSARDPSAYLLLHTFLGPVFGTAFILITQMFGFATLGPLSSQVHLTLSDITTVFLMFLVVLLPAWFFGFIPALLHAVLMLLLRRVVFQGAVDEALRPELLARAFGLTTEERP